MSIARKITNELDEALERSIRRMIHSFFMDEEKTDLWMRTQNPLLGGVSPLFLISTGHGLRLHKFVKAQLDENYE